MRHLKINKTDNSYRIYQIEQDGTETLITAGLEFTKERESQILGFEMNLHQQSMKITYVNKKFED